jgi:hypothetical protein
MTTCPHVHISVAVSMDTAMEMDIWRYGHEDVCKYGHLDIWIQGHVAVMKDIVLKALARNVIGKKPGKFAVFFLDVFSLNVVSH